MLSKVKITYLDSSDMLCCYFTEPQIKYHNLNINNNKIILSIGTLNISLNVVIIENNNIDYNRLYLSKDVQSHIYLEEGTLLQLKQISDNHLSVGPLIGVFINKKKIDYLLSGNGTLAYTQFANACKSLYGLCCLFSLENIDWDRKLIKGIIKKNSTWTMHTIPLPKVIYDRNVGRSSRSQSILLRDRLNGTCHIVNSMAKLSKLETFASLKKNPKLTSILPSTIPYNNISDLETALNKYSSIYLKPNSLSKGQGIFRVRKLPNTEYSVEYRTVEENHKFSLTNLSDLENVMTPFSEKGGGYLIQQEIIKAPFEGADFDLRVLFQKDWQGVWQASGIAGRISSPGSIITSPRSGGIVSNFEYILQKTFNENYNTPNGIYSNLIYYGRQICLSLESDFGDCVELGLDIAIDVNKRIWLIEVNGKPLKVSLKRLKDPSVVSICNKRPIEYAVYASGFKSADTSLGGLLE